MFVPRVFSNTDRAAQHDVILKFPFATLITSSEGDPFVTHVPLLLDADRGEHGTIIGHISRANPHWQLFQAGVISLAVFHGPHAYISPAWYQPPTAVPTWNYTVVHARGTAEILDDRDQVQQLLARTVAEFETNELPELDAATFDQLIAGVVAFEMPIDELEAKFKLGQNRSEADRNASAAQLSSLGHDNLATAMRDTTVSHPDR